MDQKPNTKKKIIFTFLATVIILLITELLCRVIIYLPISSYCEGLYVPDGELGFFFRPNHVCRIDNGPFNKVVFRTNSMGLRDREFGARRSGAYRIVILGDSFTVNSHLNEQDTYPRLLESNFQAAGRAVEVVNISRAAIGPEQLGIMLKRYGLPLKPDMVLYGFYENDIQDSAPSREKKYIVTDGNILVDRKLAAVEQAPATRIKTYLKLHSRLLFLIDKMKDMALSKLGRKSETLPDYYRDPLGPEGRAKWNSTQVYIDNLRRECRKRGILFIVVLIPAKYQVYPSLWENYFKGQTAQNESDYRIDNPQRLMTRYCRRNGIPVLDLLPALKVSGKRENLFLQVDLHWNAPANRIAAKEIYRFLNPMIPAASSKPQ